MGVNGGNGGHIETSGFDLDIANMKINVGSLAEFKNGEWLLDPYDYALNDVGSISAALSGGLICHLYFDFLKSFF